MNAATVTQYCITSDPHDDILACSKKFGHHPTCTRFDKRDPRWKLRAKEMGIDEADGLEGAIIKGLLPAMGGSAAPSRETIGAGVAARLYAQFIDRDLNILASGKRSLSDANINYSELAREALMAAKAFLREEENFKWV